VKCGVEERTWLKKPPEYLGIRCEALLAGLPAEWFHVNALSGGERTWLGELVVETHLGQITQ
jgi:hypothetical protein